MEKGQYLSAVLRSTKTVFSFTDIAMLWGESTPATRTRINYHIREGGLYRIRRGLYAKDKNYNKIELASRIFTPAYVSFETVLGQVGVTFQYNGQIVVASYLSREIICDNQKYSFRKIKGQVLSSAIGVENKDNCAIATKERAFLDVLYINKDYHFDNLSPLDWDKVFLILPIYCNKRMNIKVKEIYKDLNSNK